jgi:hypothetical protein
MTQTAYYQKPALLDRQKHRNTRVRPGPDFAFARTTNSLYVAAVEFTEAAKEYGIVFTRPAAGKVIPVVVLGLRTGENLMVRPDNSWDGRYVPAFMRRYPFVLAQTPDQKSLAVCIDEAYSGLSESEGEALFDAAGAETPYLRNALEFLQQYQREHQRTEAFCQRLDEAGLLKEMNVRAEVKDGRTFTVNGLMVVDEKKLMELPDATVLAMFRKGEMHLVSLHLASLSNIQRLVDTLSQRPEPAQPVA